MPDEYTPEQMEAWRQMDEGTLQFEVGMVAKFGSDYRPNRYYVLDAGSHEPRQTTQGEWAVWLEARRDRKRVAEDTLPDGTWVSTVFLGLDHNFRNVGPPIVFETMVFPDKSAMGGGDYEARASTWEEALANHEEALRSAMLRYESSRRSKRVRESRN